MQNRGGNKMSETRTDDTLIAYDKNDQEVAQGTTGTGEVVIGNLTPATSYAEGDFQVAFANNNGVSQKVAVPAFVTDPQLVESFTLNPEAISGVEGGTVDIQVATIEPADATNKNTKVTSKDPSIATIAWNDDAKTYQAHLIKAGTTEFDWVSEDGNASVKQAVTVEAKPAPAPASSAPANSSSTSSAPASSSSASSSSTSSTPAQPASADSAPAQPAK